MRRLVRDLTLSVRKLTSLAPLWAFPHITHLKVEVKRFVKSAHSNHRILQHVIPPSVTHLAIHLVSETFEEHRDCQTMINAVAEMSQLVALSITRSTIDYSSIDATPLSRLTRLEDFSMEGLELDEADVRVIASMGALTSLDLSHFSSAAGLHGLADGSAKLMRLTMTDDVLTADIARALTRMPTLTYLDARRVEADAVALLPPQLESLELEMDAEPGPAFPALFDALRVCNRLTSLDLWLLSFDDTQMLALVDAAPHLTHLGFHFSNNPHLHKLPAGLRSLALSEYREGVFQADSLAALANASCLRQVSLHIPTADHEAARAALAPLHHIQYIEIVSNDDDDMADDNDDNDDNNNE
jgi:hypothetical protein